MFKMKSQSGDRGRRGDLWLTLAHVLLPQRFILLYFLYFYTLYFIIYTLYYILGTRIASTKIYTFGYFRIKRRPKVCIKKYLSIGEHLFIV